MSAAFLCALVEMIENDPHNNMANADSSRCKAGHCDTEGGTKLK